MFFIEFSENRGMAGVSESERNRDAVGGGRGGGHSGNLDDEIALDQSAVHPSDREHTSQSIQPAESRRCLSDTCFNTSHDTCLTPPCF